MGAKGYTFPRYGMQGRYGQQAAVEGVKTTSDLHLAWDVPYEPGTLKAVGSKGGKTAVEVEVSTTGDPAAIQLSVDRPRRDPREPARRGPRDRQGDGRPWARASGSR